MKKNSGKTVDTDDDVKRDDEEQSRRFIEKAKELGCNDTDKIMDVLFDNDLTINKEPEEK